MKGRSIDFGMGRGGWSVHASATSQSCDGGVLGEADDELTRKLPSSCSPDVSDDPGELCDFPTVAEEMQNSYRTRAPVSRDSAQIRPNLPSLGQIHQASADFDQTWPNLAKFTFVLINIG